MSDNILTTFLPKKEYLHPAWYGCLHWALGKEEIVQLFRNETGIQWIPGETAIDRMIDESTGAGKEFLQKFAEWMNANIWGELEATPEQGGDE